MNCPGILTIRNAQLRYVLLDIVLICQYVVFLLTMIVVLQSNPIVLLVAFIEID